MQIEIFHSAPRLPRALKVLRSICLPVRLVAQLRALAAGVQTTWSCKLLWQQIWESQNDAHASKHVENDMSRAEAELKGRNPNVGGGAWIAPIEISTT